MLGRGIWGVWSLSPIGSRFPIARLATAQAELAVAIQSVLKRHPGIWFGWSGRVAVKSDVVVQTIERGRQSYVLTDLTKEDYDEYYNGFANRVLWPIFHYRQDLAEFSLRDLSGYIRVNEYLAGELHKILLPDDIIWIREFK